MVINPDFLGSGIDVSLEFQELKSREGELHLRFYVASGQEYALSATGIREVIAAPLNSITPIPNTSHLLLGTLNLRGRIIWVVDLGQLLEATALNTTRPEIPVIAVENQDTIMALAVDQILGMDWLDVSGVQTPTDVSDRMTPFVRGEWLLDEHNHQCLRLLDQIAILQSEHWRA